MFFDPMYFVFIAPAFLLGLWAQFRVKSAFAEAEQIPTSMSGAQAARYLLDSSGLHDVEIEPVHGFLSDHYDPHHKVLRLSPQVYQGHSMAAVGVAAHEAGHAIQDAQHYAPLVVRNLAVPAANFGSGFSWILMILGLMLQHPLLLWAGIAAFAGVVFFQVVNLPVEFDASARAKAHLAELGVVSWANQEHVAKVLNAAAWTYVAATLQSILTLIYYVLRFGGMGQQD